jgi:hypothetical protein
MVDSVAYCGGLIAGTEPDHMPPRILFSRQQRPNDLVFSSRADCNRGSAALDTIIAWLSRRHRSDGAAGAQCVHQVHERTNNEATASGFGGVHAQLHGRTDEIAELAAYIAGPHGAMMTGAMHTIRQRHERLTLPMAFRFLSPNLGMSLANLKPLGI